MTKQDLNFNREKTVQLSCAIGNFDGVHIGHKKILEILRNEAEMSGLGSAVITFDPHPRKILYPESFKCSIVNLETKKYLLKKEGIEHIIVINFTEDFHKKSAKEFMDFLREKLNCRKIIIGKDWRFGHNREGDVQFATLYGKQIGIEIITVDEVRVNGEKISSSKIREFLKDGNLSQASNLLGRDYFLREKVVRGNQIGRQIGFPTINFKPEEELCLKRGVYAGFVELENKKLPAVINFGYRPTVDGNNLVLEAHVIENINNFDIEEGLLINVYFTEYIREEIKFGHIEQLKEQILADIRKTKEVLDVEIYN